MLRALFHPPDPAPAAPHLRGQFAHARTLLAHHALLGRYVLEILAEFRDQAAKIPTLQTITIPDAARLTVCGDTHGQLEDLFSIFTINGPPTAANAVGELAGRSCGRLGLCASLHVAACGVQPTVYSDVRADEGRSWPCSAACVPPPPPRNPPYRLLLSLFRTGPRAWLLAVAVPF